MNTKKIIVATVALTAASIVSRIAVKHLFQAIEDDSKCSRCEGSIRKAYGKWNYCPRCNEYNRKSN